ncbi:hypothetical protein DPEC_G00137050 [Dallia pectoralis]|uniref:Uncharacterized protein n=1 Tax=Dallia pectoralis TaxID=75939 RepID=A0ACC2GL95_DALPE|nr:hypothetical protein DPEC_G00137050 [Dallia pectoralis]
MSGRALTWASAVWEQKSPVCARLEDFTAELKRVFGPPGSDRISSRGLFRLRQGTRTVGEYSIEFRTLAANSSWCHVSLYDAFAQGLSGEIKDELAARELPRDINSLIDVATRIDNRIRERQSTRSQGGTRATSFRLPSERPAGPLAPLERGYPSALHRKGLSGAEGSDTEPMQVGRARLSSAARQQRVDSRCCLYCGEAGHFIAHCPVKGSAHQ